MFLSNDIWWYRFHHPNKLPRIRCALHERFKPPWIYYRGFSTSHQSKRWRSAKAFEMKWHQQTTVILNILGKKMCERGVVLSSNLGLSFMVNLNLCLSQRPDVFLDMKPQLSVGPTGREVQLLVLRRQPWVPLPCTGGLSPWHRRSLSLPTHLCFLQSSLLHFSCPRKESEIKPVFSPPSYLFSLKKTEVFFACCCFVYFSCEQIAWCGWDCI